MIWTNFWDMSSGGGRKTAWRLIYIEAPLAEASAAFARLFGRDPSNVTCDCCGSDFSVCEYETLQEATAYHRGCDDDETGAYVERARRGSRYETVEAFCARDDVKIVRAGELVK